MLQLTSAHGHTYYACYMGKLYRSHKDTCTLLCAEGERKGKLLKQARKNGISLSQCLLGGGRMVTLNKEWKGQLKLTKLPDHCGTKGSLSPSSTGQNNSTISGLHSPTLLTLVSSRYSPTSFGGIPPLADGSKQIGICFQMLASAR